MKSERHSILLEQSVAQETVASGQVLADQVSALTKAKLKSDLDISFANVNLAQAKLLLLDAENNNKASMASLSDIPILGISASWRIQSPSHLCRITMVQLIADALSQRPETLALEFESQSAENLHIAKRDQLLPTIRALGAGWWRTG